MPSVAVKVTSELIKVSLLNTSNLRLRSSKPDVLSSTATTSVTSIILTVISCGVVFIPSLAVTIAV